jgi:hypothetical protein
MSSTTPDRSIGSRVTKSPTPYWFSSRMKKPPITSCTKRCAPKVSMSMTSVAPAAAVSASRTSRPITAKAASATNR